MNHMIHFVKYYSSMPKRLLTSEEIDHICSMIPLNRSIPEETAISIRDGVISSIKSQFTDLYIYPELIPSLYTIIEEQYHTTLLQAGEMVGVQAATSIGEPVSQMTLNAFHFSGISSVGIASGVPRVEEIMNASKKQKSYGMTLYTKEKMDIRTIRRKMMHDIVETYVSSLMDYYEVTYIGSFDDLPASEKGWYGLYFAMFSEELVVDGELSLHWRMRIHLDRTKMYIHSMSCTDIALKIEDSYRDLYAVASPDNIGIVDVYIDFSQMKLKKKEEEDLTPFHHVKDSLCLHNIIIPYILDIQIGGIAGIDDIFIRKDKDEWVVDTQGSNFSALFYHDWLDIKRCTSSDIWEVRRLLGVEATRQFIINEFYKVLAVSGASVGRRHIELLADSMTFQGKINSVNRYGIDRNETGPLAKASFEESVNNFFIAAVNGETDDMGVSSSVMAGKLATFGTGGFDVLIDTKSTITIEHPDPIAIQKAKAELEAALKPKLPVIQEKETPVVSMRSPSQLLGMTQKAPIPQPLFTPKPVQPAQAPVYSVSYNLSGVDKMIKTVQERTDPMPYQVPITHQSDYSSVFFPVKESPSERSLFPKEEKTEKTEKKARKSNSKPKEEEEKPKKQSWVKAKPKKVTIAFSADD